MWCSEGQAGRQDRQSQSSLLTVEAMLRIKESKQQGGSALSDEADLGSVSGLQSPVTPGPPDTAPRDAGAGVRDRHRDTVVTRTQAKLTYLLHLLLEAECLDWAGCLAIVLQDTMALVRIVKLTLPSPTLRGPAPGSTTASRSWPTRVLSTTSSSPLSAST